MGRRYRAAGAPLLPGIPEPGGYAAVYEVEAETVEQIQAVAATLGESLVTGEADISPTMDLSSVQAAWLLPIGEPITGPSRG